MINLDTGSKVKYTHPNGNEYVGVIHAVKTHETPGGVITYTSYLIDTGNENPDHKDREDYQPEQVEVPATMVKPI